MKITNDRYGGYRRQAGEDTSRGMGGIPAVVIAVFLTGCGSEEAAKQRADAKGQTKSLVNQGRTPGQEKDKPPLSKDDPSAKASKKETAAIKTLEDAKKELQNRIGRYLGGQKKDAVNLVGGILAIRAVTKDITQIEIVNLSQEYSDEGKENPNHFVGTLRYQGTDNNTGAPDRGQTPVHLVFHNGEWSAY
jgi:hypothetical protein